MEVFLLHVDGDSNVGEEVMSRVSLSFTDSVSLSRQASPHFGTRPAIPALFFHSLLAPSHMTHPRSAPDDGASSSSFPLSRRRLGPAVRPISL